MLWKSSKFNFVFPSVSIGILLLYLAWQSEATSGVSIKDLQEASKNKKINNMTCHVCHSETNENCFNFTNKGEDFPGFPQQCDLLNGKESPQRPQICMVRKFSFTITTNSDLNGTTPMKTFALKRNCIDDDKCENGCVIMGERTRLYVCSQCCHTPLCNVGSGTGSIHNSKSYFLPAASARHHFLESTGTSFLHFIQIIVTVMVVRFPL